MLASCWDFACLFVVLTSSIHDINTWHQWWINTWHQYIMTSIWWIWLRCINCLQALLKAAHSIYDRSPMNMEVRTPGGHRLLTEEDSQVWVPPTPPTTAVTESEEDERNDRSRSPPPARRLFASPSAPAPSHARPLIIPNALPGAAGHKNVYELHFEKKMSGKYESCCWARASTWFEGRKESALVLLKISI